MSVLLCKPGEGVWVADETGTRSQKLDCPFEWPCAPCASAACMAVYCPKERECLCMERRSGKLISRMPGVPGLCDMCFSECSRYLFQLSSEADCVHACCVATGELRYAAPAGVFPRCMKRLGSMLLCAGGAVNEACLLHTPDLTRMYTVQTGHPCFAADFWQGGLVLVCAAEGDDIRTVVYTMAAHAVKPKKLIEMPGIPAGIWVCPDGTTALISSRAGLCRLDLHTGILLWNRPEWALCMRADCMGEEVLISDTLDGSVWLFHYCRPWERRLIARAPDAQACFL